MRSTRRALLAAAGSTVAAGLAGCLDTGGEASTPTPTDDATTPTSLPETATPTDGGGMRAVRVRSHPDLGELLVGPEGLTLYMFDSDTNGSGTSSCSGGCADNWPPLTVDGDPAAGDGVTATLTTFERDGGTTQVAAAGWPLYYFAADEDPGDANGQGVGGVWWVLRPDGTPVRPESTSTTPTETPGDVATETPTETPGAAATETPTESPPTATDGSGGSGGGY